MESREEEADRGELGVQVASSPSLIDVEAVTIQLPAPHGWSKKFIPKKGGTGTPRRNEIVFIAPTGEEIKNKRQLDQYLKTDPDGPPFSEFDWGTGDTPRRSARLSSKPNSTDMPQSGSSRKRQKISEPKKEETDGGESADDGTAADRTEDDKTEDEKDVEMKEAEAGNFAEEEKAKEADEAHGLGLPDGRQLQAGESKVEEMLEQEISLVPEESKIDEQPEDIRVERAIETPPIQGQEQLEKNKPEAAINPSDADFSGDANNGTEGNPVDNNAIAEKPVENKKELGEKPAETFVQPEVDVSLVNTEKGSNESSSAIVEKEIEGSKQGLEEPEKKVSLEEVGPDSNTANGEKEGAILIENQPVKSDGAAQEPDESKPISC